MTNHRPYSLIPYDPDWANRFNFHAEIIQKVLGPIVLKIHHIGSTSIPGMAAKPNIDIEVVASNLDEVRNLSAKMVEAGYTPRGDYSNIGEEYFTEDAKNGERLTSIHVLPAGHTDIQMQLNFRDYLRTHAEDRELYADTKRRLYGKYRNDYGSYDSGKKDVIEAIKKRAESWSKSRQSPH
jgi:GrpB-like predicted nucleotidyltransferase (UPF0157 family)